ncbi:BTAD domain-containing putative transcriptional regulator [Streptomyces sp. HUAS ZL42]|uniref:AfsR/SARP family transcriptional regulator n=1 Tax=Streptomyces sp. HUAS ZL42 TaxID=3231715 RepID=UPI00345EDB8D
MQETAEPPRVLLNVLGTFAVLVDGKPVQLPFQAQRVLGCLAAVKPAQSRAELAGRLWTDSPQDHAMASLRNALWRIRSGGPLIRSFRRSVALDPQVWTDIAYARRCAAQIELGSHTRPSAPTIDILDNDLLPGWDDEWLIVERERLRQLRIHALEAIGLALIRQGRYAQAIQAALAAVRAEPLRESAQTVLVSAHLGEGNVSEALRQLETYRQLLARELGLRPSERIEALLATTTARSRLCYCADGTGTGE